ncbi:hypothetical protein ACVWW1_006895 [Bradyrhizobium sp. JR3.5]
MGRPAHLLRGRDQEGPTEMETPLARAWTDEVVEQVRSLGRANCRCARISRSGPLMAGSCALWPISPDSHLMPAPHWHPCGSFVHTRCQSRTPSRGRHGSRGASIRSLRSAGGVCVPSKLRPVSTGISRAPMSSLCDAFLQSALQDLDANFDNATIHNSQAARSAARKVEYTPPDVWSAVGNSDDN